MIDILHDLILLAASEHLDAIEARIRALVDAGKLEAAGNLSRWGHSEVRRAQLSSAAD